MWDWISPLSLHQIDSASIWIENAPLYLQEWGTNIKHIKLIDWQQSLQLLLLYLTQPFPELCITASSTLHYTTPHSVQPTPLPLSELILLTLIASLFLDAPLKAF